MLLVCWLLGQPSSKWWLGYSVCSHLQVYLSAIYLATKKRRRKEEKCLPKILRKFKHLAIEMTLRISSHSISQNKSHDLIYMQKRGLINVIPGWALICQLYHHSIWRQQNPWWLTRSLVEERMMEYSCLIRNPYLS